jgi:hypothetical protein
VRTSDFFPWLPIAFDEVGSVAGVVRNDPSALEGGRAEGTSPATPGFSSLCELPDPEDTPDIKENVNVSASHVGKIRIM